MLSDDALWMDTILPRAFEADSTTMLSWNRIKTALAEAQKTPTNRHITSALYVFQEFMRGKGFGVDPECIVQLRERLNAEIGTS